MRSSKSLFYQTSKLITTAGGAVVSQHSNTQYTSGYRSLLGAIPASSLTSLPSSSSSSSLLSSTCLSTMVENEGPPPIAMLNRYNFLHPTAAPLFRAGPRLGLSLTIACIGSMMYSIAGLLRSVDGSSSFMNDSAASDRMSSRLSKHGFTEKCVIPDGNCQMRSIADQMFKDEEKYKDVRMKVTSWLQQNEKYNVKGGATLGDFIDRDQFPKWSDYTLYMSKNGIWGDHLTLLAAAEAYNVSIQVISNVEDNGTGHYITTITPVSEPKSTIHLSHWHEMHYNSLYPKPAAA